MQCQRLKKDGNQCRARSLTGKKYCALHADPGKAAELGSKGGRQRATKSPTECLAQSSVASPKTAEQLRDLLAETVAQVKMGELEIKTANALAYIGTALLRAIEASSYESRVASFEQRLARLDGHNDTANNDPDRCL
jgi:hypothetical protein